MSRKGALKESIRRSFSRAAATYEEGGSPQAAAAERLAAMVRAVLPEPVGVLDIGCGTGSAACFLGRSGAVKWIVGVDLAEGMIERASVRNIPRAAWVVGDAHALPIACESADVALANFVFQWFENPCEVLRQVRRALAPRGFLAAAVLGHGTLAELEEARQRAFGEAGPARFFARGEFEALLAAQGLEVIFSESGRETARYGSRDEMLRKLKAVGALIGPERPSAGLDGRRRLRRLAQILGESGPVEAAYVVHYFLARK